MSYTPHGELLPCTECGSKDICPDNQAGLCYNCCTDCNGKDNSFEKAWEVVKIEVKPFKLRSRKDNDCEHDMEITDESEHPETGTLYRTLTCSRCGESTTSSPS